MTKVKANAFTEVSAGRKSRACVANNTWALYDENTGDVAVRLHSTNILTFHKDGSFTVNSGGWRTVTTKARLNEFLPAGYRVYQEHRSWFIRTPEGTFPFEDGDRWNTPESS